MSDQDQIVRLPPWRRSSNVVSALSAEERDWGLNQFNVPAAWEHSRGAGIRVAILDTGCDETHRDLVGQVVKSRDFTGSPYGSADVQGHGTHCAGVVAANEDDRGVVGICPDLAQDGGGLLIGKVLGDDGSGLSSWVAQGIRWATGEGAGIISCSLGSASGDPRIASAIDYANEQGAIVIAAAGNDGTGRRNPDRVNYPAKWATTIAVGAVGSDKIVTEFSSQGPAVDIAAPGENILSTVPNNQYVKMSGTSMATPFVAGVSALAIASKDGPAYTYDTFRKLLKETAKEAGAPGRDSAYGFGLIDPDKMLDAADTRPGSEPPAEVDGITVFIPRGRVV